MVKKKIAILLFLDLTPASDIITMFSIGRICTRLTLKIESISRL